VRGFINRQIHAIARGGAAAFIVRFPPLVGGMVLYAVLWLNAAILALLVLVDLIAIVVCFVLFARQVLSVRGG
jgi:hypothetical protein